MDDIPTFLAAWQPRFAAALPDLAAWLPTATTRSRPAPASFGAPRTS